MSAFSDKLKAAMISANLSQYQLARKANMSRSTISGYCCDRCKPTWQVLKMLAEALGVDFSYFDGCGIAQPKTYDSNTFIGRLNIAFKNSGKTRAQISAATGFSYESICDYLSGRQKPPEKRIPALSKALGVEKELLLDTKTEYDQTTFAGRLKYSMSQSGINQPELARLSGVPYSTISNYLTGSIPRKKNLMALAEALEVEIKYLSGTNASEKDDIETFKLSDEEVIFAEKNLQFVWYFLSKRKLDYNLYYDVVIFRFLYSVRRWLTNSELQKYPFISIAEQAMSSALSHDRLKQKRLDKIISLDAPLDEDGASRTLADVI